METRDVRAVITGGGSGLGRHMATELLRAGASVAVGDINEAALDSLRRDSAELGGTLTTHSLDVSQEPSVRAFLDHAHERLGRVNTVVNNAGILLDGLLVTAEPEWVRRLPMAQWRRVLDVNLTGAFLVAREAAARMLEAGERPALIVNMSSVYRWGNEGQSSYSASKAALDALTRTWALELAPHGIRVAAIAPGLVNTPILENVSAEALEQLRARIPLRRFGDPREIWMALDFIIRCEYYNGSILEVDGGACI